MTVAVTGVGICCAGSDDAEQFWSNVRAGRGSVAPVDGVDIGDGACRIGGQVLLADGSDGDSADERLFRLLSKAVAEAVADSTVELSELDPRRVGIVLGQCQGSLAGDGSAVFMHTHIDNLAAELGATGPRTVISTACTAGAAAIAIAAERILSGDADVMIAGGADVLSGFTWRGFSSLQSLSADGCAAYSRSHGLVLGEGAGIFLLESAERAAARGRTPVAELQGWGFSADAHHITAPDASGRGALLAIGRALARAGVAADQVDYVCGHGTGTSANDGMEMTVQKAAFGDRAAQVPLSSIKPMIGHTLGAAGAIEAAATVFALRDGVLPPTINFDESVPSELDFVPNASRPAELRMVMSNNFAFGGNNSSLLFGRSGTGSRPAVPAVRRRVTVTGAGVVAAGLVGYDAWRKALFSGQSGVAPWQRLEAGESDLTAGVELPVLTPRGVTTPGEWRHLDALSRLALTVARQAWVDSGLRLSPGELNDVAVIYGSGTGPLSAIRRFQETVARGEPSPVHFPNTVYTAAPGHLCKALGLRGPTTTFTSGGLAGMHAIDYAVELIARGEVDRAVVVAAEELSEWHLAAGGAQRGYLSTGQGIPFQRGSSGANLGGAGVALVLEAEEGAVARGGRRYGSIAGMATGGDARGGILPDPTVNRWTEVVRAAVGRAGLQGPEIGYVAGAANGASEFDSLETSVVSRTIGTDVFLSAPKSISGETLGAAGPLSVLAALAALETGEVPPTAGLSDPIGSHRVRHVVGEPVPFEGDYALANAVSLGGNYAAMVVGR